MVRTTLFCQDSYFLLLSTLHTTSLVTTEMPLAQLLRPHSDLTQTNFKFFDGGLEEILAIIHRK
jgi:hypothetical protein